MVTKLTVLSNPRPGREDEFNRWYDEVHVPDLLAVPGIVGVRRYRLRPASGGEPGPYGYLAVYDLEGDPDAVLAAMGARAQEGRIAMSEALDAEHVRMEAWEPITPGPDAPA